MDQRPKLYIIAGCNGVGKSTSMMSVLPAYLTSEAFVNADIIAKEMSPDSPDSVAVAAGREMLLKIQQLVNKGSTFVIETTLSGRGHLKTFQYCKERGYQIVIVFFWLSSVELAIERIKDRVADGGHFVSDVIVRRRYLRGIKNLLDLYGPKADRWKIIENTLTQYRLVARKDLPSIDIKIENHELWNQIIRIAGDEHGR